MEGDQCEVLVQVINPSSYELRIANMQLLTEDVEFEAESASIILPPAIDQKPVATSIVLNGNSSNICNYCYANDHLIFLCRCTTEPWTSESCWLFYDCTWFEEPL